MKESVETIEAAIHRINGLYAVKFGESALLEKHQITNTGGYKNLKIEGATLSLQQINALVEFLKKDKTIKNLDIWHSQFIDPAKEHGHAIAAGNKAIAEFAEVFRYNSTIQSFGFSGHYISDGNPLAVALGDVLKHNCALQQLNLYQIGARGAGVQSLIEGLSLNRTLKVLYLTRSYIELADLKAMQKVLNQNPVVAIYPIDADLISYAKSEEQPYLSEILSVFQKRSSLAKEDDVTVDSGWQKLYLPSKSVPPKSDISKGVDSEAAPRAKAAAMS